MSDLIPTCPRCAELCSPDDVRCSRCGARLAEDVDRELAGLILRPVAGKPGVRVDREGREWYSSAWL